MKLSIQLGMVIIALCLVAGCAVLQKESSPYGVAPAADTIRVGGGDAPLAEVITPVKETFEEENPSLRLVTVQSKVGTELADLANGSLDAIVSTMSLEKLLMTSAETGAGLDKKVFREMAIGRDETVVFLNQGIKIKKLTRKQLKAIFTGRITNWKKVGGPNRRIVIVWSPAAAAENEAFIREVLQREPVVANFLPAATVEEMRTKVLATPGAIGIGPNALVAHGVRVPQSPAVTSSVVMITRGEPSAKVRKLVDFVKDVACLL